KQTIVIGGSREGGEDGRKHPAAVAPSPWRARRRRDEQLRDRYPFAGEVLTLYLALLDVQEPAFEAAAALPPEVPDEATSSLLARELLPRVVEATVAAGPPALAEAVVARFPSAAVDGLLRRSLLGAEQAAVDRYLARASCAPVLEAMPAGATIPTGGEGRSCPQCGGLPQLSYSAASGDALVTGPRRLVCARCAAEWIHPRMVCAACG